MSVTLKHIANELGVSQPLVTNALNGKPGVNPKTRLRIEEAARRMGYDRNANRAAQLLAAQRHGSRVAHGTIATIYPPPDDVHWSSVPFHRSLVEGLQAEAAQRGLDLLILPIRGGEVPRVVRERQVDGLIFVTSMNALSDEFRTLSLPAVTVCSWNPSTFSLLPDSEGGTYAATRHLIELGHRRIAYLGMHGMGQSNARYVGYQRAMVEAGLLSEGNLTHVLDNVLPTHGREGMDALIRTHRHPVTGRPDFTALVCQNDLVAMGAVRRAEEEGMRVPDDLSVVGFDDVSMEYNFQPVLTSLAFDRYEMGRRAVERLCGDVKSLLDYPGDRENWQRRTGTELFPTQLMLHHSTRALN